MFERDICLCATVDCPKFQNCLRGAGIKREGIYTMSLFGTVCNEQNGYTWFKEIEDANFKEVKDVD